MLLYAEIGGLVWGMIALVSGKLTLSKDKVVTGAMARIIGLLLMVPLPLMLCVGVLYGVNRVMNGQQFGNEETLFITLIEFVVVGAFWAMAIGLAFACASKPPRRRWWEDDDDEEFRRRKQQRYDDERSSRYDDDDEPRRRRDDDDERSSRRGRYDDEDEPRRRRSENDDDERSSRGNRDEADDENGSRCPSRGNRDEEAAVRSGTPPPLPPAAAPVPMDPGPSLVRCEHCQAQLKLAAEHLGKKVRCPSCKEVFQAPARQGLEGIVPRKP